MEKSDYADIKARVSMRDLLEHYLDADELSAFKKKDDQMRGSCFLCDTKKRSTLSINTARNIYQSFCCKSKGNILNFVAEKEDITIDDAVHLLFQWFDTEAEPSDQPKQESDEDLPARDSVVNEPLSFDLKKIDHGHEKVKALGISKETAEHFGVGYYQGRGMFKDHVVFPIHNIAGDLIAYAGVADVDGDIVYPNNFQRDMALYNAHQVKESLEYNSNPVVITNSVLDVVRLYESGVDHPVGTMCDSVSQLQMDLVSVISQIPMEQYALDSHSYEEPEQVPTMHDATPAYKLSDLEIMKRSSEILASQMRDKDVFSSPVTVKEFLKRKLSHQEREIFMCLYLDNKNQMIAFEELFAGTVDQVSVYPREVVKQSLKKNASALIVGHNHPSGIPEPSAADRSITEKIADALKHLDIRFLDHIIVGGDETVSLAERGLI